MEQTKELKELSELYDAFSLVATDISKDREMKKDIESELSEQYGIMRGTFSELLVHPEKIEDMEEEEVIVILNTVFHYTMNEKTNPSHFYNPKSIKIALKGKREIEQISFPRNIPNVLRSAKTEFVTVMSFQELNLWLKNKMINYNFDCQRLPVEKVNKKGKINIKPKTNLKSIKAIANKMLNEEFSTDTIILNILVNGNDNIEYTNGNLTIYEGTQVDVIDGWHRLQGIQYALEIEPNLEGYMNVSIKHYTLKRAQDALGQFNTVNPFDKVLARHYSEKGYGRSIAKKLQDNSDMKGRIAVRTRVDKKLRQLTNMDVLSKSIEEMFNIENDLEEEKVFEHLKKFFGVLINSYPKEFKDDMYNTLQKSWINHHNTFVLWTYLAKVLYDKYSKDFPIEVVVDVVNKLNMDKNDSSDYHIIMKEQGNRNSNRIKNEIKRYAEEKINKILSVESGDKND